MNQIIAALPIIHIVSVFLLALLYLYRSMSLVRDTKTCNTKNTDTGKMVSATSFITLLLFFSGIIQAFLLKIPFNNPYILTKIFGLLAFTGLSIAVFMPYRKKTTALIMMGISFIILITVVFISTTR